MHECQSESEEIGLKKEEKKKINMLYLINNIITVIVANGETRNGQTPWDSSANAKKTQKKTN